MEEFKVSFNGKRSAPFNSSAFGPYVEPAKISKRLNDASVPLSNNQLETGGANGSPAFTNGKTTHKNEVGYRRLMLRGEVYCLGDTVLIRETETTNMIARIERIISENGDPTHPKWPMIEVTWQFSIQQAHAIGFTKKKTQPARSNQPERNWSGLEKTKSSRQPMQARFSRIFQMGSAEFGMLWNTMEEQEWELTTTTQEPVMTLAQYIIPSQPRRKLWSRRQRIGKSSVYAIPHQIHTTYTSVVTSAIDGTTQNVWGLGRTSWKVLRNTIAKGVWLENNSGLQYLLY
eukprot:TRINITY_DN1501_c0_g1_i1.p2 TRINITY_DN1501_c0_g1~~TRINITY_DN1501_c0_g1_i1.p2  ORF type:complete len:288 (-),score=-17.43 TRINITY_DN1501_c0_g1_i1:121-984(-)